MAGEASRGQVLERPTHAVLSHHAPASIADWKALANGLLTEEACAFQRNVEISSSYAWIYRQLPSTFKWAAMAAIASNHVRLALFPLRLDADASGYVNLPRSLGRHKMLLTEDVNLIRATNNAIFDDIFWVHLAYLAIEDGMAELRTLLHGNPHYAQVLSAFELIDRGRRILEDPASLEHERAAATDDIWAGNIAILEHEQRALVQPNFDRLSSAFARIVSMGSASTFDVRGLRQGLGYFTSFYLYSFTGGAPRSMGARTWPNIVRFEDRWPWLTTHVVPRFRRFDANQRMIESSMQRILDEANRLAATPCQPRPAPDPDRHGVLADRDTRHPLGRLSRSLLAAMSRTRSAPLAADPT